jgi:hypothetical protein
VLPVATAWLPKERLVGETLTAGVVPVPERLTVCGLPVALSEMLTAAVRAPVAAGVKVTLIVQLLFAATELPQVLVWLKSLVFVPVTVMLGMLKLAFPVFVRATAWAALVVATARLAKVNAVAERLTEEAVPLPVKPTFCVLPATLPLLSVTTSVALRLPAAAGVKVTLIEQLAPAATELPHVLLSGKSQGFAPVTTKLLMPKAEFPLFVSVTV